MSGRGRVFAVWVAAALAAAPHEAAMGPAAASASAPAAAPVAAVSAPTAIPAVALLASAPAAVPAASVPAVAAPAAAADASPATVPPPIPAKGLRLRLEEGIYATASGEGKISVEALPRRGEGLAGFAQRLCGDARLAPQLLESNRLPPGSQLKTGQNPVIFN